MTKFIVKGSNKKLQGEIGVLGSKNAGLKAFAAALLTSEPVTIKNVPQIEDMARVRELLKALGADVVDVGKRSFKVTARGIKTTILDRDISKSFRASVVLAGPILARFGRVEFFYPGGCVLGKRPIDVFLNGFQKMGARVEARKDGSFKIEAKRLRGAEIFFRIVSVTGTETLMMAATLARGRTVLRNAAMEPEIKTLADFLNNCGARISGAGTSTIIIDGVQKLRGGAFLNPPDRIETGSFAILGALAGDNLRIVNCAPHEISSVLDYLESMGVQIKKGRNWLSVSRPDVLKPVDVKTHEYPGFPTDLQSPFAVLLTQASGPSLLFETVFEGRLGYVNDLGRMGANITLCDTHRAIFNGPTALRGREVESPDIRAGLAFLLAAVIAKGESIVHNAYYIDRGYEKIEDRLSKISVNIKRAD